MLRGCDNPLQIVPNHALEIYFNSQLI